VRATFLLFAACLACAACHEPQPVSAALPKVDVTDPRAGQTVTASAAQFATPGGVTFDARRVMPNTLIVSAEIGEGGPTGVYAVRL
jgi:hypothetical protein